MADDGRPADLTNESDENPIRLSPVPSAVPFGQAPSPADSNPTKALEIGYPRDDSDPLAEDLDIETFGSVQSPQRTQVLPGIVPPPGPTAGPIRPVVSPPMARPAAPRPLLRPTYGDEESDAVGRGSRRPGRSVRDEEPPEAFGSSEPLPDLQKQSDRLAIRLFAFWALALVAHFGIAWGLVQTGMAAKAVLVAASLFLVVVTIAIFYLIPRGKPAFVARETGLRRFVLLAFAVTMVLSVMILWAAVSL